MKVDVVMPQMGESIAEGTIAKWLKKPGDKVERDESILEITTDKVDSEIPAPEAGTLAEILVDEGETVEVGAVLAKIDTDGEAVGEKAAEKVEEEPEDKEEKEEEKEEAKPKTATTEEEKPKEKPDKVSAEPEKAEKEKKKTSRPFSPVVRKVASQEGLSHEELQEIEGSGAGGRLTKEDVLQYLEQKKTGEREPASKETEAVSSPAPPVRVEAPHMRFSYDPERVEVIEMSNIRKRIAEHMVYSKHISPHTYNAAEVDMSRIVRFRESSKRQFEKDEGFKLTYTPFILHAAVLALKAHPMMNSSLQDEKIIRKDYINLGVAVAVDEGLLVPVIKNADEKNLLGLARSAWELARKARDKKLKPDDIQGGTFTVTNPGVFGNIFGFPIINQPQLGILGVGAVKKKPVVIDDAIAIRSMMYITLSYDHRVIDGALAARFIQEVRENLEEYDIERAI